MRCEELSGQLMDELMDRSGSAELPRHLEHCSACREEAEQVSATWELLGELPPVEIPSSALRTRFQAALQGYRAGQEDASVRPSEAPQPGSGRPWGRPLLQLAAALGLVVVGLATGLRLAPGPGAEMGALRGEVRSLSRMVALSLLAEDSASRRLQGVSYSGQVLEEDRGLLDALIAALQRDPSVNVRLAAADALAAHLDEPAVRRALFAALPHQSSPVVQLELVDLALRSDGRGARLAVEKLAARPDLDPEVRHRIATVLQRGI
jgi:hypothetical protein